MKLLQWYHADLLNGEGLREVLFFSGCDFHCPSCYNREAQDPEYSMPGSHEWGEDDYKELLRNLDHSYISGTTISGGDGFSEYNKKDTLELCRRLKKDRPDKTIWIYTGYTFEKLRELNDERWECLRNIDVLCDGQYIKSLDSPSKSWVGSENQRVINIPETLTSGKIVLWKDL